MCVGAIVNDLYSPARHAEDRPLAAKPGMASKKQRMSSWELSIDDDGDCEACIEGDNLL